VLHLELTSIWETVARKVENDTDTVARIPKLIDSSPIEDECSLFANRVRYRRIFRKPAVRESDIAGISFAHRIKRNWFESANGHRL
jgi:hypothetical protein